MDVQKALQAINTKQPDVSDIISDAIRWIAQCIS
jgi:hypothetical protein